MLPVDASLTHRAERIGYVLKVYPRFSETFVVTEILAREAAGEDLAIFALRPTSDARFHPEISRVQAPVMHLSKPVKLSDAWTALRLAQQEVPGLADRLPGILAVLTQLEPAEAIQGIDLAVRATREGITHLHAHFASLAARVSRVASALTGIPYSVTTHAKDLFHEDVDLELLQDALTHADHVVAISRFNEDHLISTFPELDGRVVLIHNGLDLARFRYAAPQPVTGPLKVAAVGRLVEKKGFTHLIEAARVITERAAGGTEGAPSVEVRIAGDGELRAELAAEITAAGLDRVVELIGPRSQDEVRELLTWADVMVAPCVVGADGNADGLPTVLLEAMAMGVPVIGTDVTGIPEAVRGTGPRPTGILLRADQLAAGDGSALVEAITAVAADDFPRVALSRAARDLIESNFNTATQSRLLADHQRQCVRLAS